MSTITLQHLLDACSPGGASVLTSVTPLEPAAGPHASVAPAKFLEGKGRTAKPVFAYERRFWDGEAVTAVLIDSKQSQSNRLEAAVSAAIADQDPVLARNPRIELRFEDGQVYSDIDLPHRAFDGQIRAGTINGEPATAAQEYRELRNATVADARPLLEKPLFAALKSLPFFLRARAAYGTVIWNDDIDIAPEHLYECSSPAMFDQIA